MLPFYLAYYHLVYDWLVGIGRMAMALDSEVITPAVQQWQSDLEILEFLVLKMPEAVLYAVRKIDDEEWDDMSYDIYSRSRLGDDRPTLVATVEAHSSAEVFQRYLETCAPSRLLGHMRLVKKL